MSNSMRTKIFAALALAALVAVGGYILVANLRGSSQGIQGSDITLRSPTRSPSTVVGSTNENEKTRDLSIPSSLEPSQVVPAFGNHSDCSFTTADKAKATGTCFRGLRYVEGEGEKGLLNGYIREYSIYPLRTGERIGVYHPVLTLFVLKYDSPAVAQQLYAPALAQSSVTVQGVSVQQGRVDSTVFYSVQSKEFIVVIKSIDERATQDAIGRIIELYGHGR